eukprot:TRINITY_DN8788_c0_g1_i1.p1 TRINITY_DN8788_c0_g1~~TRINITY_DN8788_c0_g1_i1.p1  ORF type:complete len:253 (+),score=85.83 TRINITY_DN8788_c0_g1_i1:215-973(+)
MKAFPNVKKFWHEQAASWPAVETKSSPGLQFPEMYWLNKHYQVVGKPFIFARERASKEVEELLREKGFSTDTPAPEYVQLDFEPTAHCLSWRPMLPDGSRPPGLLPFDGPCGELPKSGHKGTCYCRGGQQVDVPQAPPGASVTWTCESKCAEAGAPADEELLQRQAEAERAAEEKRLTEKHQMPLEEIELRLRNLFKKHAMQRTHKLPHMLRAWRGRELALLRKIAKDFGEPDPVLEQLPPEAAAADRADEL